MMVAGEHKLTNVNWEKRVADCAICGPGVSIEVTNRKGKRHRQCEGPLSSRYNRHKPKRSETYEPIQVTPEQVRNAQLAQAGRCAICGRMIPLFKDHDHKTGIFRALLCRQCNLALGLFGDDIERLKAAVAYLETHKRE